MKEVLQDVRTLFWFIYKGPSYYPSLIEYVKRKFLFNHDNDQSKNLAEAWCKQHSSSLEDIFASIGFSSDFKKGLDDKYIKDKFKEIGISRSNFGGGGHHDLLFNICENINAKYCLETGVAYGWSSEAILKSIVKRGGQLISVDMPMIGQTDYHLIGFVVSDQHKDHWKLLRKPDKNGLINAINHSKNKEFDFIHYDSDKSYYGRKWAQPIMYRNLRDGGFLISDDIEDNLAFKEFVEDNNLEFYVTEYNSRYIGIIKKESKKYEK